MELTQTSTKRWGPPFGDERGQAITEYLLLLAIVALTFVVISRSLADKKILESLAKPITQDFARAYRYGHTQAKGPDDGGPENHPRFRQGKNSFRIFINAKER